MKNVCVVGYPKSGNTYLTRLLAELLHSPSAGYYMSPNHPEMAMEGLDRKGNFKVFKSHDPAICFEKYPPCKIVYIVRDPRDVFVSSAFYFDLGLTSEKVEFGLPLENSTFDRMFSGKGPSGRSWDDHVSEFLKLKHIHICKYEDLIDAPEKTCREILNFVGAPDLSNRNNITKALDIQSFDNKKKFLKGHEKEFLRKGGHGHYVNHLSKETISKINTKCLPILKKFNYHAQ